MLIKTPKAEINISNWLIVAGLFFADSFYVNHCKKKILLAEAEAGKDSNKEEKEEEES